MERATDTPSSDEMGIEASGNGERSDSGSTEEIGCESSSSKKGKGSATSD